MLVSRSACVLQLRSSYGAGFKNLKSAIVLQKKMVAKVMVSFCRLKIFLAPDGLYCIPEICKFSGELLSQKKNLVVYYSSTVCRVFNLLV